MFFDVQELSKDRDRNFDSFITWLTSLFRNYNLAFTYVLSLT